MVNSIEQAAERLNPVGDATSTVQGVPGRDAGKERKPTDGRESWKIDVERLERRGYLTPRQGESRLADEYRAIKRPLLRNVLGLGPVPIERSNLIMVTSALSGEGKTFTAMNLSMSISMEMDKTVLLIDADVIKASLTRMIGLYGHRGITDVLVDDSVSVGEVIRPTGIPRFNFIAAGRRHALSTELLASLQMKELAEEMANRYSDRIIVFDAPPLLVTSQASVLAHLTGQVVMVVEAGRTQQEAVKGAIAQIDPDKVVGMVLNKSSRSGGDYYGSYYGT